VLTSDRLKEMNEKLGALGGHYKLHGPINESGQRIGEIRELKLPMRPTDALIGLGIAKDENEAAEFLTYLVSSTLLSMKLHTHPEGVIAASLLQMGFYIGISAATKGETDGHTN
jgi:hypothetical protein